MLIRRVIEKMTDEENTKRRRGASLVRRDCTGPNGSQSGRRHVHNKSRLSFSLRLRPRRSSYVYVSVLFAPAVFPLADGDPGE